MARFDVYRFKSKQSLLLLDVQADLLSDLSSRVVVPLVKEKAAAREALPRLKPVLTVNGAAYVMMTTDIGVVPVASLGAHVANIEAAHRNDVIGALDFLFQGF